MPCRGVPAVRYSGGLYIAEARMPRAAAVERAGHCPRDAGLGSAIKELQPEGRADPNPCVRRGKLRSAAAS